MVGFASRMLNQQMIQFGNPSGQPDRLLHADCLVAQADLPDECLDLVYIDPPFGTGKTRKNRGQSYPDSRSSPDVFVEWLASCLAESHRLLKPSGSLFVHLDHHSVHYVKVHLDGLFGRSRFINELIWCYSVGGKSKRRFARKHDTILWYGKTADYAFYPEQVHVPRKPSSHMRVVMDENGEPVQEKTDRKTGKVYRYPVNRGKIPEDWWTDIELLNRSDKERVAWPTQKPSRLLERIVKGTTKPGDMIADWFSGSGTTAVVAQRERRNFIVTDVKSEAIACARARLSAQGEQLAAAGAPPADLHCQSSADLSDGPRQES
ncbi:MAG: site-specific DNA-methyltransferase [Myxococcales bacterium]|nr:site-specific DNA-methyltransferase [Myxococcales bacterium]